MSRNRIDPNHRNAIIIALITSLISLVGVTVGHLFSNWDKIFPKTPTPEQNEQKATNFQSSLPLNGKIVQSILILNNEEACLDVISNRKFSCKQYTFSGKSGQKATIEMNSDDFDPFLILRKPNGDKLALNDDISPQNLNAKIVVDLIDDGNYTIIARTKAVGESGKYSIRAVVK
jgi:hypothetical protein